MRAVVVSADVGESHAQMAAALVRELERRPDVEKVTLLNGFYILGRPLAGTLQRGFRFHVGRVKWSYDLAYHLFTRLRPARRLGEAALRLLGGRALARALRPHHPDVVVSTYPVMNPILAALRSDGRLRCPAAAVVGPLGGLAFWVQPGLDLHLMLYPEAIDAARELAGPIAAQPVRPLVDPAFFEPLSQARAQEVLGLDPDARHVLISGGGWGVGDLAGAIDAALTIAGTHVIALTGRGREGREALERRHAGDPRVSVLGFTQQMRDFLCAVDAFVTTTAGISCLEARLCGTPTICYGFHVGHVRDNVRALRERGLADVATSPGQLRSALEARLGGARIPAPALGGLPSGAELTVKLARGEIDAAPRVKASDGPAAPVAIASS